MTTQTIHTHCLICEQLCGLQVTVTDGAVEAIRPDKANPYSWRDFCIKGQRAADVATSPWRLRSPMRRTESGFVPVTWDEAIEGIGEHLARIVDQFGPDAVGGYAGNPIGFSFGAVAWHNLFLSTLGSRQVFSVQSIDSNAKHVAAGAMFGVEMLALVPDVDASDYIILIGTNPAVSKFNWGGKVPNGWRRIKDRIRDGAQLVVIDPRRTETAQHAARHLAPRPESDWALLLGMIKVIIEHDLVRLPDEAAIAGLDDLTAIARAAELETLAAICDVPASAIAEVALGFARARSGFAFTATGPALGGNGTLAQWLTLALNVITDRFERPGGRFMPNGPVPWQHRIEQMRMPPRRLSRVRQQPVVVGNQTLAELADEILTEGDGQIRALIMGGGNPVSTGPDGARLQQALGSLDLFVSVDLFMRESHRDAHWLIPAVHFLEREEIHVGLHAYNEQPFIQTTRQVLQPPEGVRPDWMFYRDLAARIGKPLFGGADMDPTAMVAGMLARGGMVTLDEVRAAEHGLLYGSRSMGHLWDMLRAQGRTIQLCPAELADGLRQILASSPTIQSDNFQLISRRRNGMMNASLTESSGSVNDDETAETVEMARSDAARLGLQDAERVILRSASAAIETSLLLSDDVRPGTLVMAHGWGSPLYDPLTGREVFRKGNARNMLVSNGDIDRFSGVPRLNGTPVEVVRAGSNVG